MHTLILYERGEGEGLFQVVSKMLERLHEWCVNAHILLHPLRYKIVNLLKGKSMHINELAKNLEAERRLVAYHLLILERYGFVNSKYEISQQAWSKGKALKRYWITDKVQRIENELKENL